MLDGVMTAGFKNIVEANDVRLDVGVGVGNGVADTGLGGEVHDNLGLILHENIVDKRLVREVALDKRVLDRACRGDFFNLGETVFLQADVVVVVHAVKADDMTAGKVVQQANDKVCADEAGGTGDEDITNFV